MGRFPNNDQLHELKGGFFCSPAGSLMRSRGVRRPLAGHVL
jgi:hypothetical protein